MWNPCPWTLCRSNRKQTVHFWWSSLALWYRWSVKSNEIVIFDVAKKNFPQLSKSTNNDDCLMFRFDDRIYGIRSFRFVPSESCFVPYIWRGSCQLSLCQVSTSEVPTSGDVSFITPRYRTKWIKWMTNPKSSSWNVCCWIKSCHIWRQR